jgi:predicted nucleic acid-binding protein
VISPDTSVVFDINVYLDYILGPDGSWPLLPDVPPTTVNPSADAISLAFSGHFRLFASPHILRNVAEKMARLGQSPGVVDDYITLLVEMCAFSGGAVVQPADLDHGVRDYEDNLIVGLARDPAVDARVMVTSDTDLLDLGPVWNGRLIMHPRDFVRHLVR